MMNHAPLKRLAALLAAAWVAGCATLTGPLPAPPELQTADNEDCRQWFTTLDAATDSAGVRDGGAYRPAGFAWLRTDRFLASFGQELDAHMEAFSVWVAHLQALDASAREAELQNLPLQFLPLAGVAGKPEAALKTRQCADLLTGTLLASAPSRALLIQRARVPDDYADWQRALGLYPVSRLPFFKGVERWQQETARVMRQTQAAASTPPYPPVTAYASADPALPASRIAALYSRLPKDALGIPRPDGPAQALLLRAYAPVFEVETAGPHDRFGSLYWGTAPAPQVNTGQPVVYQRLAYTRYQGQTLLQLVYSIWFPERPQSTAVDLLSGQLDGVVLRVTLDASGTPLLYDTIHACGCYHLFFPTTGVTPRPAPQAGMEWAFVPARLPAHPAGQRVVLRLASRSHYVVGLRLASGSEAAHPYATADDNALRSLPVAAAPDGSTRSAFWPNGIVPGTERGERLLFWPMGIDSPGAMRQWGRQPTAFVGRRHFDDADLLERRFEFRPR